MTNLTNIFIEAIFALGRRDFIDTGRKRQRPVRYTHHVREADLLCRPRETKSAIVRAVDGPLAPLPCASVKFYRRCSDCDDEKTCEVRRLMREVRDAASAILDNTSLAEAAALNVRKKKKRPEKA